MLALAIIETRARKKRRFLLGLADNGASLVLTLSAALLAIIGPCWPTKLRAHIGCQWDLAVSRWAGRFSLTNLSDDPGHGVAESGF